MIKETKEVDFYTTGKQPSQEDFAKISQWIKEKKQHIAKPIKVNKNQASHMQAHTTS